MANYERYMQLHNDIMNRLENGEITTEQAKEVNDLAFDKYIVERVGAATNPDVKKLNDAKVAAVKWSREIVKRVIQSASNANPSNLSRIKEDLKAKSERYDEEIKHAADAQDIEKIKAKIQVDIKKYIANNKKPVNFDK